MKIALSLPFLVAPAKDRFASQIRDALNKLVVQNNADVTLGATLPSATTLNVTAKHHHVSGTAAIANIVAPAAFTTGSIHLIPDGIFTTVTTGNIGLASTAVVGKMMTLVYDGAKWWPSY